MPDNVAITAGSGTVIATDQIGTDHYQRVKLTWGVDGVAADVSDVNPIPVQGLLDLAGTEERIGAVGYDGQVVKVIPTISTSAYAAGDAVGGEFVFTGALRIANGTARLKSLTIIDESNLKLAYTLLLFDSDYAGVADNAPFVWNTADHARLVAAISVRAGDASAGGDYVTINNDALACIPLADILVAGTGGANLYGALILMSGTPTFGTTSDLHLHLGLERN